MYPSRANQRNLGEFVKNVENSVAPLEQLFTFGDQFEERRSSPPSTSQDGLGLFFGTFLLATAKRESFVRDLR